MPLADITSFLNAQGAPRRAMLADHLQGVSARLREVHALTFLQFSPDQINVGANSQPTPCDYAGPEMTVALNPEYASYAVRSAVGPEVRLEVNHPHQPMVFRSATDSSFICMIMPIRLD